MAEQAAPRHHDDHAHRVPRWDPKGPKEWPAYVDEVLALYQDLLVENKEAISTLDAKVSDLVAVIAQIREQALLLGDDAHRRAIAYAMAQAMRELRRQEWRDRLRAATRRKVALVLAVITALGAIASLIWTVVQLIEFVIRRST